MAAPWKILDEGQNDWQARNPSAPSGIIKLSKVLDFPIPKLPDTHQPLSWQLLLTEAVGSTGHGAACGTISPPRNFAYILQDPIYYFDLEFLYWNFYAKTSLFGRPNCLRDTAERGWAARLQFVW